MAIKPDGTITAWGSGPGGTSEPTSTCVNTTISTATELALDVNGLTYRDSLGNLIFQANPRGVGSESTATLTVNGSITPFSTGGAYSLGSSTNRWNTVYATNGTINTSDTNQKTNINTLNYGLNEILNINPISFNWKDDELGKNKKLGFSAQELQGIIPEVVSQGQDGLLGVYYSDLIPVAFNAIKQQQTLIHTNTNNITQHTGILQQVQNDIFTANNTLTAIQDEQTQQNTKLDHLTHIQKLQTDLLTLKQDTQNYHTIIDDLTLQLERAQAGIDLLTAMSTQQTTDLAALLAIDPGRIIMRDVTTNADGTVELAQSITLTGISVTADRVEAQEVVAGKFMTPDDRNAPTAGTGTLCRVGYVVDAATQACVDGDGADDVARPVDVDVTFDWMIVEDEVDRHAPSRKKQRFLPHLMQKKMM